MKETRMWAWKKKTRRDAGEGVRNKYNYPSFVPMAKNVLIYSAPKNISTPVFTVGRFRPFFTLPPATASAAARPSSGQPGNPPTAPAPAPVLALSPF